MRILKWTGIGVLILLVGFVGYSSLTRESRNAAVAEDIRTNPDGERARRAMLVTLDDGRMYPVNYIVEGEFVFMGIDGRWWRHFQNGGSEVSMLIRGKTYTGHARVILDDPDYTADVFSRLRPAAPEWLPDWLNGKLVEIRLEEDRG